jgi:hypothetical protein
MRWLAALSISILLVLLSGTVSARQYKTIQRVSTSTTGVETRNASRPVINGNGNIVAFWTDTGGLVPEDTNFAGDVFVRDRASGVTSRVSLGFGGIQTARPDTNPPVTYPDIGIDDSGTFVVYASDATNIVSTNPTFDTNGVTDVFIYDRGANVARQVSLPHSSVNLGNPQARGGSTNPTISGNSNIVVFRSVADNLVASDTNNQPDIFAWDRTITDTNINPIVRINVSSAGVQSNNEDGNSEFTVSDDGRYIAFESLGSNLVTGDTNGRRDIFIRDRTTNTTTRISMAPGAVEANGDSVEPFISGDGQFVVFTSFASNLVPGDTNGHADIFLWSRASNTIQRVSVDSNGVQPNGGSARPVASDNARYIVYWSVASNLVFGDTNGQPDFFLFDRTTGITTRVNVNNNAQESNGFQGQFSAISDDGSFIAFESFGSNLVAGDTNNSSDVFVAQGGASSPYALSVSARAETSISLVWSDSTTGTGTLQEDSMVVQRRLLNGNFQNVITLARNATSYVDTGRPECTEYQYRVLAVRDFGGALGITRSSSNLITTKTLGCPPGPFNAVDPVNNDTVINVDRTSFIWTASEEAQTYALTITRTAGGPLGNIYSNTFNHVDICTTRCTFTPDSALKAELSNGTYQWSVVATNAKGSTGIGNPTAGGAAPTLITFFVNDAAQPRNFDLLGPINDTLIRKPAEFAGLTWRDNLDAETYSLSVIKVSTNTRLGSVINISGLTYQNDSDALTCDSETRICTYTLSTAEIDQLTTGSYAWTVLAVSPGGTPREARNGAGKFGVRTTDIELLRNGSFETADPTSAQRARNWAITGTVSNDTRLCYPAEGTAHDELCVWRFRSSATENIEVYQEFPDRLGMVAGEKVVLSGFVRTTNHSGILRLRVQIFYTNPATPTTTAVINIPAGSTTGYLDLPDVQATIAGPVNRIRVSMISKAKTGTAFFDSISLTLLAEDNIIRDALALPSVPTDTTPDGALPLPMP